MPSTKKENYAYGNGLLIMIQTKEPIVIIGGGMIGATCALMLCQLGLDVHLIEADLIDDKRDNTRPYDLRVSAIQHSTESLLKSLGVWDGILQRRLCPFHAMHIQDWTGLQTQLNAHDLHEPVLGYLIENDVITAAVFDQLRKQTRCTISQTTPQSIFRNDQGNWCVNLHNGAQLTTSLLIGADGAQSQVRAWLELEQDQNDYHQHCIVGTVTTEKDHQHTCWQHYRPEGPFALLPLAEKCCSIAWYLPKEAAQQWLNAAPTARNQAMTEASAHMLGTLTAMEPLAAFPLVRRQTKHYIQENSLLIGDAAHTVHPQAGQGVNLGMLDIIALESIFRHALAHHQPLYDARVLIKFEQARHHDATLVQRGMEGLNWLFSDKPLPMQLRKLTSPLLHITPFKTLLAAVGRYGRLTGSLKNNA